MFFSNIIIFTLGVAFAAASSTPSFLQSRATACEYQTGNGTCISTSSCAGTNVTGLCSGSSDIQCCVRTCETESGPGFCESTSKSCTGGNFTDTDCPGNPSIQCCVAPCAVQGVSGVCQWTGSPCDGGSYSAGHCPGPADIQCCVVSNSPVNNGTGLLGIDISGAAPSDFWSCAASNYQVVAIEGYIQGCRIGGEVNANFLSNYNAAKAAGIPRIDAYLFPCTGTQASNDSACKDPSVQLNEFLAEIDNNTMVIDHYWFDVEPTPGGACNAWNLGNDANEALAKQWVALLQASGRNWGIYAHPGLWTQIFASESTDIGSQLPLWIVQVDGIPGVNTTNVNFGGWTSANAKQYDQGDTECGWTQGVDLDSFL